VAGPMELLDSDAVNRGMAVVMACYENDLKRPLRSLVSGELARTLLIQVGRCCQHMLQVEITCFKL
jgi:hypothetical protein